MKMVGEHIITKIVNPKEDNFKFDSKRGKYYSEMVVSRQFLAALICTCFIVLWIPEEWGKTMFPITGFQYLGKTFSWQRWTLSSILLLTFVGGLKGLWIFYATLGRDLR